MDRAAINVAKAAVGAAILIYLINFAGAGKLYDTLTSMKLAYLPPIIAVLLLSIAIRALNFKVLLLPHENKERTFKLKSLVRISFISWAAGIFTPGKLGEFSSIYMLKKEGLDTSTSAAVSMLNKVLSTMALFPFAIVGLVKFFGITESVHRLQIAAAIVALTLVPYLMLTSARSRELMKKVFAKLIRRYERQFAGFVDELDNYLSRRRKLLLYSLALNFLWIAISSWLIVIAFAAFGQRVGFVNATLINSIGTVTSLIPVTIGGTGVREATAIVFFGKVGISSAVVLSSHIIMAALSFAFAGLVILASLFGKNRREGNSNR